MLSIDAFWKGLLMGIGPCILTKVCCAFFMGRERFVIGWAMVGRAEFAYLIAQMALAAGSLSQESFSIVIWALVFATISAPLVFRFVLNRYIKEMGIVVGDESAHDLKEEKLDFGERNLQNEDRLKDLEGIDIQGIANGKEKAMFDASPPEGKLIGNGGERDIEIMPDDNKVVVAKHRGSGVEQAKGSFPGSGLLCCIFFNKLV